MHVHTILKKYRIGNCHNSTVSQLVEGQKGNTKM